MTETARAIARDDTNCPECPRCACGCVPDWEGKAQLRCTGCKTPLRVPAEQQLFGGPA